MAKTVTIPKLKAKAQLVFNAYIRERDKDQPCISCGQFKTLQAGHYYPVQGYDGLRFNEDNVHGECAGCNCFDEGHLIGYGGYLVLRIGVDRLTALGKQAKDYKHNGYKFSRHELLEIIALYKKKITEL